MIHFNYKGNKYIIFFYPCGFIARVTKKDTGRTRDLKYDSNTTVKTLLKTLDRITF